MANPPGKCIFCGCQGNLSKEHVFADWLGKYIPRSMTVHQSRVARVHIDREDVTFHKKTGDPHSQRVRRVCEACNSGWMSKLQEAAKPFLVPLILGHKTTMHRRAQTLVSGWIAMTVMTAEFTQREVIAIPENERARFRTTQKPLDHWRIWIGRHQRHTHPLLSHHVLRFTDKKPEEIGPEAKTSPNTQTTTICLGEHLVIHVMSSYIARSIIRRWKLPREIASSMIQIWPARLSSVVWPGNGTLTDAGLSLLADHFITAAQHVLRARPTSEFRVKRT